MTNDETCNGWTNRETWTFMLHVNNDQGLWHDARVTVGVPMESGQFVRQFEYEYQRADALRDWAETLFTRAGYVDTFGGQWPDALADIACEIGSLDRINWPECVESLLSD